jgi:hypothetical protein
MRGKFFNCSVVKGYVPTETSEDEEKGGFFDALERPYDISPRNHIKIVLGDYHVQVGMEVVNFPSFGKYSLHNLTNDKESPLIQFAVSWNMITGSTFYPRKDFRKSTWRSPDGVTLNQIIV